MYRVLEGKMKNFFLKNVSCLYQSIINNNTYIFTCFVGEIASNGIFFYFLGLFLMHF